MFCGNILKFVLKKLAVEIKDSKLNNEELKNKYKFSVFVIKKLIENYE